MMDCKKALLETSGDFEKAIDYLRKKGIASASKKEGRATNEGSIGSYIHAGGKIGVLLEVNCETDFVARTDSFQALVNGIAMHIAALAPRYVSRDEVDAAELEREKNVYRDQLKLEGKPADMIEKNCRRQDE
jgi:elongation factor Ts